MYIQCYTHREAFGQLFHVYSVYTVCVFLVRVVSWCFFSNTIAEGDDRDDDDLWEWWHTVLIVCIVVVAVLGVIVAALIAVS